MHPKDTYAPYLTLARTDTRLGAPKVFLTLATLARTDTRRQDDAETQWQYPRCWAVPYCFRRRAGACGYMCGLY